jgi:hypothetical protein
MSRRDKGVMGTPTPLAGEAAATPTTIVVALLGGTSVLLGRLQSTLDALSSGDAAWTVTPADALTAPAAVQIALCCYPASPETALSRWPDVAVVALVPENDDGSVVQAALDSGAMVCVRGADPALVAAFVRSVARRRGLLTPDRAR